jgi:DNA-binding NtrC family response regulator
MPPPVQARLLWAFENPEKAQPAVGPALFTGVRIVAGSRGDLVEAVEEGRFRADLYYRLAVVNIRLPQRQDQAGGMADPSMHFLKGRYALYSNRNLTETEGLVKQI